MSGIDDELEQMQADGRITVHDADEVRNFASFLVNVGPVRDRGTPEGRRRFRDAYREHYPEHFYRDVAPFWGADPWRLAANA